jgi:hypothetical protein
MSKERPKHARGRLVLPLPQRETPGLRAPGVRVPGLPSASGVPLSKYMHAICSPCWNARNPKQHVRTLRRLVMSEPRDERCCFFGETTSAGICTHADPKKLRCRGEHD